MAAVSNLALKIAKASDVKARRSDAQSIRALTQSNNAEASSILGVQSYIRTDSRLHALENVNANERLLALEALHLPSVLSKPATRSSDDVMTPQYQYPQHMFSQKDSQKKRMTSP